MTFEGGKFLRCVRVIEGVSMKCFNKEMLLDFSFTNCNTLSGVLNNVGLFHSYFSLGLSKCKVLKSAKYFPIFG